MTCPEKTRIQKELNAAFAAIVDLGTQEIEALIAENMVALDRLEIDLERVKERKDALWLAYKSHVEAHDC